MIVFDLKCSDGHVFEVWFASTPAYEEQRAAKHIICPACASTKIEKAVMAPNISAKQNQKAERPTLPIMQTTETGDDKAKALMQELAAVQTKLLERSAWVGKDFERKARAMDAGEETASSIHGEVSAEQARGLLEDGIPVLPLPFPVIPPDKRN